MGRLDRRWTLGLVVAGFALVLAGCVPAYGTGYRSYAGVSYGVGVGGGTYYDPYYDPYYGRYYAPGYYRGPRVYGGWARPLPYAQPYGRGRVYRPYGLQQRPPVVGIPGGAYGRAVPPARGYVAPRAGAAPQVRAAPRGPVAPRGGSRTVPIR